MEHVMAGRLAGFPWFSEDDYAEARRVMADSETLPMRYQSWLQWAETAERDLREQGHHPVRVAVVPSGFLQWCKQHGCKPDASARREFAHEMLAEAG